MLKRWGWGVALGAALVLGACSDSTGPTIEVIEDVVFQESLGVDLDEMTRTSSGLYYQDLVVGEGAEAVVGAEVSVAYVVRFRTGEFVDSSEDFPFVVGDENLYEGFNEGVVGMRVGGQRKVVLPPDLVNDPRIPGRILVFDIELLSVTGP